MTMEKAAPLSGDESYRVRGPLIRSSSSLSLDEKKSTPLNPHQEDSQVVCVTFGLRRASAVKSHQEDSQGRRKVTCHLPTDTRVLPLLCVRFWS